MTLRGAALPLGALLAAVALAGCGGGASGRPEAPGLGSSLRKDRDAQRNASALAAVVAACRRDNPSYVVCNESDELVIFLDKCVRDHKGDPRYCGGSGAFDRITFGNGSGQAQVTHASTDSFTVTAYSSSGAAFSISSTVRGSTVRSCSAPRREVGGCRASRW